MEPLPHELYNDRNQAVLEHLADTSAHSDVAEALLIAVEPLGDAHVYCPDRREFRYIAIHTCGTIFGYAIGMDTIAFRLGEDFRKKALVTGGEEAAPDGEGWAAFKLFRSDWPEVDTRFWARKAYVFARETHST